MTAAENPGLSWRHILDGTDRAIALPESQDQRVLVAAHRLLLDNQKMRVALFGARRQIIELADKIGLNFSGSGNRVIWVADEFPKLAEETRELWQEKLRSKGRRASEEELSHFSSDSLAQAGTLAKQGKIDGVVAGCVATTAEVIRAALRTVGTLPEVNTVSGSFLMHRPLQYGNLPSHIFVFADCGVVIDPSVSELVDIAAASAGTFQALVSGIEPVVAFLSFSTKGSARHPMQQKVAQAAALFAERYPSIKSDGEMQFDAAYASDIGLRKAPTSLVPGRANVFVFPNLDAGNIAYKMAQRLGGFHAYGPILQGTAKPFSDLSRGASSEDIVMCSYITLVRSLATKDGSDGD